MPPACFLFVCFLVFVFPQDCLGSLGSLMFPYTFLDCLLQIYEECHRSFDRDYTESVECFG